MRKMVLMVLACILTSIPLWQSTETAYAIEKKFDYRMEQKIEKAIEDLQDKKGTTKRKAKKQLIAWGPDAVEPLLAVVRDWENQPAKLRVTCVDILGEIGDESAVPVVISVLEEKRMTMRYTAARSLGNIGDNRAAPGLIKLLKDDEWEVRFFTSQALGKIGDATASKPLSHLLEDDPSEKVRLEVINALDKLAAKSEYETIIKALSDTDPEVRGYAVELLASWSIAEALPILTRMLREDRANTVRASCAHAVGMYEEISTVPVLIQALGDEYRDVKVYALNALKKISGQNFEYDQDAWNHWLELNKGKVDTE